MYFDVATSVATCFLTVVLVDSLLPSLSYSLLHRCRVSIVAVHWCLEMFTSCSFHACFAHLVPLTSFPITSFAVKIAVASAVFLKCGDNKNLAKQLRLPLLADLILLPRLTNVARA